MLLGGQVKVVARWGISLGLVVAGVAATRLILAWPDVTTVALDDPTSAAVIARAHEEGAQVSQLWAPMEQISPQLALAVLVAEDIEFFQHHGFSLAEMRIAVEQAREGGRMRGASTITQQLAKNLWLSSDRTVARKLREALLAVDLERFLTKRRILELYLNVVQFGPGVFGAEAAARHYFAKPALFLTEDESAQLAAALTRPSYWYPGVSVAEYGERVELIRRRMANAEFLWRHLLRI
jgi:monofunctional biosynthetic peptidoglycan transglycosylase